MLKQIITCINKIHSLAVIRGNESIEFQADTAIGLIDDAQKKCDETNNALHEAQKECANLAGKVAELQAHLAEKTERLNIEEAPIAIKEFGAWDGLDCLDNLPDGSKLFVSTQKNMPLDDFEQFMVRYHEAVWNAASDDGGRVSYDEAGRDIAKEFISKFFNYDGLDHTSPLHEIHQAYGVQDSVIVNEEDDHD